MTDFSADVIRRVILRKAKIHGVPSGKTCLAEALSDDMKQVVDKAYGRLSLGDPVLVFVRDRRNWTAVGIHGVGGSIDATYTEVLYENIDDIDGYLDDANGRPIPKRSLDTLAVVAGSTKYFFKSSPGAELFALWNVCLKLHKMRHAV